MHWKASSTPVFSFAEVSKLCGIPCLLVNSSTAALSTALALWLGYFKVCLVANDKEWEALWVSDGTLAYEHITPLFQVSKAFLVGYVVCENACIATAVKCGAHRLKSLLSCCVPNLVMEPEDKPAFRRLWDLLRKDQHRLWFCIGLRTFLWLIAQLVMFSRHW